MRIFQTVVCTVAFSVAAFGQQSTTSTGPNKASSPAQPSSAANESPIKPPANPITVAQIKEMQQLTGAEEVKKRIVSSAMEFYRRQFPAYIPQDVIDDLNKSLQNADLEVHAAEIYPKYLSTEDAAQVIVFYKSTAGQHMIAAQPYMMTEMQRSAVEIAQQTAKDVITRHKAEIEAAQQKYMQQQQQQRPSLNSPQDPSLTSPGTSKPQGATNPPSSPQK